MKKEEICICGNRCEKNGICNECICLLKAKKSKSIRVIEKFREDYNRLHNTYKSYGQFVAMIDAIARRKKYFDDRRKKENSKKIRRN